MTYKTFLRSTLLHLQKFVYMDHMWITGQEENKTPFLAIKTPDGKLYPWVASQADVFSTKWKIVLKGA